MTAESCEQLPRLLRNSAILLDKIRGDAENLQQSLGDFIPSLPRGSAASLDVVVLQSLDHLAQVLTELATAFAAASNSINDGALTELDAIIGASKLEIVRDILSSGTSVVAQQAEQELF